MKKNILNLIFLFIYIPGFAQNFIVKNFTADYYISKDGYFDVVERYDVAFFSPSHGIFRDFITKFDYKDATGKVTKRNMYISDIEVPGQKFSTNKFLGKQLGDNLRIKIGDKEELVDGSQHYEIKYRVKNALFFNGDIVEFYWNVKSPEWMSVFEDVSFTIHAPDGAVLSDKNCFVYAGDVGDSLVSDRFTYSFNGNNFSANSTYFFVSSYQQSVTALVKLPKSLITEVDFTPSFYERYKWQGRILGVLLLMILFVLARIKAAVVKPITSYYPPEDMDSALAGTLIDDITNPRDVQSLLPYWGSLGYIKMEEVPKGDQSLMGDLKLTKLKDLPADSPGYQLNIYLRLFLGRNEVYMSSVRGSFGEATQLLQQRTKELYKNAKSSRRIKIIGLILSWIIAFSIISWVPIVAQVCYNIESGKFIAFTIISYLFFFIAFPILFAVVVNMMRRKSARGKQILGELYGFRQFIKMAEADRLKALLEEDPYYFEKTMPYAVAFNLLKEWAGKFEGLLSQTPTWYTSSSGNDFTMNSFTTSMNNSISRASLSMVSVTSGSSSSSSSSSSSGGGFSGGGAGSGGGGSW